MPQLTSRTLLSTSRILSEYKEIKARRQAGVEAVEGRGYEPYEARKLYVSAIWVKKYVVA